MYKIFLVEDDNIIADVIIRHLETWGFRANAASDFRDILPAFLDFAPHLVILDISLPFFNGYHWCSEIRKLSDIPIIFLSSAGDNMNIVMAMNMGGDDFIAKPFELSVLTAKLQAMLRRTYEFSDTAALISHRGAVLDTGEETLLYDGKKAELTKNEFRIMQILMELKGRVVSREDMMERLWQTDSYIDDNTLSVNVTRLRKKLETIGLPDFITTKKGSGYLV